MSEQTSANPLDLPPLPSSWRYQELGDLLEANGLSYGIVQPGSETPGGVPIVRVQNIRNGRLSLGNPLRVSPDIEGKHERTRLKGGEVLLSLVGTVGESAIAPPSLDGWNVARAIAVLRVNDQSSNTWVRLCLSSRLAKHYIKTWLNTTVQATLNLRDVRRIPIPIPPNFQRQAIEAVICALDDKIAANDRIATTILKLTSSTLEEMLASDGTLSRVHLSDIADVNQRKVKPEPGGSLRYLDISSVSTDDYEWPDLISWEDAPGRARRKAAPGDTIWSTVRPNRKSRALILDDDQELVVSTGFAVLSPRNIGPAFLYEVSRRDEFVTYLESVAEGSAYPAVRAERFLRAEVPLLSPECMNKFESWAMELHHRVHASRQETRVLAELRDTLLPKLMSGEIRIRDAEKAVEDAV
ncbi:restriction endonuclease subunit S [Actinomadura sp. 6N118]|uniref:restriction endonuclease subunit S n=1 Tax=Actinomadura sp. 6N118 TaxID=3375151 RepID=UPI0037B9606C